MRNLKHVPIEKLEAEPSHMSMRWHAESRMAGGMQGYRRHYPYNNHASNYLYEKIRKIVYNSVGKDWNDTYSKIKALAKHVRFEFTIDWVLKRYVEFPHWSAKYQRWKFMSGWRAYECDLEDHIKSLRKTFSNHATHFYYVCPISDELRLVKSGIWNKEKNSDWWRRHYKFQSDQRKKKRKMQIPTAVYKMINNPPLFKFYRSIKNKYNSCMKDLEKGIQIVPPRKKGSKSNMSERWHARSDNERFSKAQIEIESLKNQIQDLEAGNFGAFFESAVYLYAQQKECHHYETP